MALEFIPISELCSKSTLFYYKMQALWFSVLFLGRYPFQIWNIKYMFSPGRIACWHYSGIVKTHWSEDRTHRMRRKMGGCFSLWLRLPHHCTLDWIRWAFANPRGLPRSLYCGEDSTTIHQGDLGESSLEDCGEAICATAQQPSVCTL